MNHQHTLCQNQFKIEKSGILLLLLSCIVSCSIFTEFYKWIIAIVFEKRTNKNVALNETSDLNLILTICLFVFSIILVLFACNNFDYSGRLLCETNEPKCYLSRVYTHSQLRFKIDSQLCKSKPNHDQKTTTTKYSVADHF